MLVSGATAMRQTAALSVDECHAAPAHDLADVGDPTPERRGGETGNASWRHRKEQLVVLPSADGELARRDRIETAKRRRERQLIGMQDGGATARVTEATGIDEQPVAEIHHRRGDSGRCQCPARL